VKVEEKGRLLSLDVFRGLTIAGMILVNSPGNDHAYATLEHAQWHGWTPTDLVFPFFVFILGVSLALSLSRRQERGQPTAEILQAVGSRTLILLGLGLFLNGYAQYDFSTLRWMGVLQRLAFCYLAGSLLFLKFSVEKQAWIAGGILLFYWILLKTIPVPGFGAGDLSREGNLAAYLDRLLMPNHLYTAMYDPEGLLSTLPAITTVLFGTLAGLWMLTDRPAMHKVYGLLAIGASSLGLGAMAHLWFPINKALWSPSYVLWTGGAALCLFGVLYWVIDLEKQRVWSRPLEWLGANAIGAYVFHLLSLKIQNRWIVTLPDGTETSFPIFLTETIFSGWATPEMASLLYAITHTLLWFYVFSILYRRQIFIKI